MGDRQAECPDCGAHVPHDPGFTVWCECGWNLQPLGEAIAHTFAERIYLNLGRRHGTALFEQVKATETTRPRAHIRRFVLVVLSAGVLLTTPLLVTGAVVLVVLTWLNLFAVAAALFLLTCAWLLRPRLFAIPREHALDPRQHPNLERVVGEVAEQVGAPQPDVLAASADFDVGVGVIGHGWRRGMVIGLPLLATLDERECVALLGHALGHLAHGDDSRGRVISTAVQTVSAWCEVLTPTSVWEAGDETPTALAALGIWVAALVPRTLLRALVHLEWADAQLSEYHADRVAATVAGSVGARQLVDKLLLAGTREQAVHRVVHGLTDRTVLAEIAHLARRLPLRERERLHRMASLRAPTLDATHPPEGLRLRMLAEPPELPGTYVLRREDREAIDRELARSATRVERDLIAAYQSVIHGL